MRFVHPIYVASAALATVVLNAAIACAQEAPSRGIEPPASERQLDDIQMSIVDEKLAISLAVETHVQRELIEYALTGLRDEQVRQLAEKKLRTYERLLAMLDRLTGGKTAATLARAPRQGELQVTAFAPADAAAAVTTMVVAKTSEAPGSDAPPVVPASQPRPKKRGGLSSILENTATGALVKLRLEIAEHYAELLRTELAALPAAEFDRHYMRIEMFNQIQVLSMLRVFEAHASPQFAAMLHEATTAAGQHVAEARAVWAALALTAPEADAGP